MTDITKEAVIQLIFDAGGSDASLLTRLGALFGVLFKLDIVKNGGWPVEKLGSEAELTERHAFYGKMFEGGLSGYKGHIKARKQCREEMVTRVRRILQYVAVMGSESDITALLNSGVVSLKSQKRPSRKTAPLST